MLKKTVTYENFDGETVTQDFYFNMTKAELLELEVSEKDGFVEFMQNIIKAEDGKEIIANFKKILLLSYGKRVGQSFIKNDELRAEFEGSPAFSEIFMELATDATAGAAFVNAIVPKDLVQKTSDVPLPGMESDSTVHPPVDSVPVETTLADTAEAAHQLTDEQLRTMTQDEIIEYFKTQNS